MPRFDISAGTGWFFNSECACDVCRLNFDSYIEEIKGGAREWSKEAFAATPEAWKRELIGAFALRATEES